MRRINDHLPIIFAFVAVAVVIVAAIAGNPRPGAENPEPSPTEAQRLQSRTNAPPPATTNAPAPPAPKLVGIVLRDFLAIEVVKGAPAILIVDKCYERDLTNVYRWQRVPVWRLDEP